MPVFLRSEVPLYAQHPWCVQNIQNGLIGMVVHLSKEFYQVESRKRPHIHQYKGV